MVGSLTAEGVGAEYDDLLLRILEFIFDNSQHSKLQEVFAMACREAPKVLGFSGDVAAFFVERGKLRYYAGSKAVHLDGQDPATIDKTTTMLQPWRHQGDAASLGRIIGYFVVVPHQPLASLKTDLLTRLFFRLETAYDKVHEVYLASLRDRLISDILTTSARSSRAFDLIARHAIEFLPQSDFFACEPPPLTDVMAFNEGEYELEVRGSTGPLNRQHRISIEKSITGIVIKDRSSPLLNVDPRKPPYRELFLNYNQSIMGPETCREVVLLLEIGQFGPSGVLNFEFGTDIVFSDLHEYFLMHALKILSQLFLIVELRLQSEMDADYATRMHATRYLDSCANFHEHAMYGALVPNKFALESILARAKKYGYQHVLSVYDEIDLTFRRARERIDDHKDELKQFMVIKRLAIRNIVERAVGSFKDDPRFDPEYFNVDIEPDARISADGLLEGCLHTIIDNALKSITEKKKRLPGYRPRIEFFLISKPEIAHLTRGSLSLVIRDNGLGVPAELLERLRRHETTGRNLRGPGMGLALLHVERYMSLAGSIDFESDEGEGFAVILNFKGSDD
jgi:Histidine kinase-, DNA gyrase B-, and HSP90-like ATPase